MKQMRIMGLLLVLALCLALSAAADTLYIDADNPPPEIGSIEST